MIDRACISLNNNCNLKCRYCHFQDKQYDFASFGLSDLIQIADNIHNYCMENNIQSFKLGVVGSGEPMIKKNEIFGLLEYIAKSYYTEMKLYTITNGVLLTKEDIGRFFEYREIIKVCFSLDGYEELHNYGRGKYHELMEKIAWYKEMFGEAPSINATVNKITYENKERVVSFYKGNGLLNVTFSKLVGYFEPDLYITDREYNSFMEYIKKSGLNSRQFSNQKKYDCTMYGRLCGVGRTNVFITPEGIYPCGRFYKNDKYLLGDFNSSLSEVERKVKEMKPVADGKCYYTRNVEAKK